MERDPTTEDWIAVKQNFNSHAHVERDGIAPDFIKLIIYFNSHAHVERDFIINQFAQVIIISTHTLTWSVTWTSWI